MREKTESKRDAKIWLPRVLTAVVIALAALALLGFLMRKSLRDSRWHERLPETIGQQTVYDLESYAEAHGFAVSDYPEKLVELYQKNPDARQFVLEYPMKKNAEPPDDDLSDEITPGEIPALYQWDPRWGYRKYNGDLMGLTGCGPTALSMAIIGLTGNADATPWALAQYAEEHRYNVPGEGTSWRFIPEAGAAFGLQVRELALGETSISDQLQAGRVVLCCVGEGDFTDSGHFLLISGLENGMYRICDPNSPSNTAKLWTYERLASQIRGLWTLYAAVNP